MTSRGMNSSSRIYNLILSRAFQTVVVAAESHKIISQGRVGPPFKKSRDLNRSNPSMMRTVHPSTESVGLKFSSVVHMDRWTVRGGWTVRVRGGLRHILQNCLSDNFWYRFFFGKIKISLGQVGIGTCVF